MPDWQQAELAHFTTLGVVVVIRPIWPVVRNTGGTGGFGYSRSNMVDIAPAGLVISCHRSDSPRHAKTDTSHPSPIIRFHRFNANIWSPIDRVCRETAVSHSLGSLPEQSGKRPITSDWSKLADDIAEPVRCSYPTSPQRLVLFLVVTGTASLLDSFLALSVDPNRLGASIKTIKRLPKPA